MKIQCDVCNREEASLFCSADEAALCDTCDHRVHHANILAVKHHRFSLLHPSSSNDSPRCDICQERRGFVFCQEDRAILCRECDLPIHTANEHTQKHNRFLLTGVKLSASSSFYSSTTTDAKPVSVSPEPSKVLNDEVGSTSSISEYLIEMLPGWHVQDFLDSSSAPPHGFCKTDDLVLPLLDTKFESNLSSFSSEDSRIWVTQVTPPPHHHHHHLHVDGQTGIKEPTNMKVSRRWSDDGFSTVPQISPPSSKRTRLFS
ncbi:hypothetical protein HHK36_031272 [Tetracentron sinense]|uniref:B box-type domain-containing protein n=1 Tax=Tetracentron sinense TaxID=13715 RepID=A0A834YAX9_TETSI|nr:hypothetical protein HHK36_031272 [Tetracentron sinense]